MLFLFGCGVYGYVWRVGRNKRVCLLHLPLGGGRSNPHLSTRTHPSTTQPQNHNDTRGAGSLRAAPARVDRGGGPARPGPVLPRYVARGCLRWSVYGSGHRPQYILIPPTHYHTTIHTSIDANADPDRHKRVYGVRVPERATVARVPDGCVSVCRWILGVGVASMGCM